MIIIASMGFLEIAGLGKVHYHEYGSGTKLLFAFHGYGMSGRQFDVLRQSLMRQYRIIGFDHFFHGTSVLYEVKEASVLAGMQPESLKAYINVWFEKFGRQRFSLLGYSIGASMALCLTQQFADQVDEVFLMAPDGLVRHKGLHFLRTSFIGQKLFRRLTYSSWMMAGVLKILNKTGVIDNHIYAVASRESDTPQKRMNAYFTVHFNKNIYTDIAEVAALINKYHIRCRLYFGRYDQLFPEKSSKKLLQLLQQPEIYVLPADHWIVTAELDDFIAAQTT